MALFDSTNWFGKNIAQPVAAGAIRVGAAGLDAVGADRSAQGYYRQASNITNPSKTLSDGTALSGVGLPLVTEYANTGGLPPQQINPKTQTGTQTDPRNTTNTTTYDPNAYGGYGSAAAQQQANAAYNTYGSQAQTALSDLFNAYGQQKQALASQYGIKSNQLQSGYNAAKNNYDNSVTDQNQNLLREQNQVRQGTYNAYQNLMNLLGALGGGGTSVAQNWAPTAAQHFQNAQLGDANQNTASNLRSLSTNWGNFMEDWKNQNNMLNDQRNQDFAKADSSYEGTRNRLNEILSGLNNRSLPLGDLGSSLANIRADIPNLKFVQPTYTGTTPVFNAPNLSSFEAAAPAASFATPGSVSNSAATPALAYLLNQQKRQQQPSF